MQTISFGSRGSFVALLQRLLNRNGAAPPLRPDGDWGPRTDAAFQRAVGATSINGLETNDAIWRNLGINTEFDHPVRMHPQPTNMTCWSASTTMMTGTNRSIGAGGAQLTLDGGLEPSDSNVEAFARAHGMRVVSRHQSLPVSEIIAILRNGPAMVCGWGPDRRRRDGSPIPPWGHVSVMTGIWSTGDANGLTTLFRVHDPWPPNRGEVWYDFYTDQIGGRAGYGRFGDTIIQ